eukprot:c381_g1_i1.p1 GENE.c381_g1_i1~~c381_g1_i1.p1  ORF type:complete len:350 (-),score=116.89 c381_g1_i1:218-1237(-)
MRLGRVGCCLLVVCVFLPSFLDAIDLDAQLELVLSQAGTLSGSKLGALTEALLAVKALATADLHALEQSDRENHALVSNALVDAVSIHQTLTDKIHDHKAKVDEIDGVALPSLKKQSALNQAELASLNASLSLAQMRLQSAINISSDHLDVIVADSDTIAHISQRAAELLHNADLMSVASKQLHEIATRNGFDASALNETCETRQDVSSMISLMFQQLAFALNTEKLHQKRLQDIYDKYEEVIRGRVEDLNQSEDGVIARVATTEALRQSEQQKIAVLTSELSVLEQKQQDLREVKVWLENAFTDRYRVISASVDKCTIIVNLISVLQAKLDVRSVLLD